jgi:hypothetical protein
MLDQTDDTLFACIKQPGPDQNAPFVLTVYDLTTQTILNHSMTFVKFGTNAVSARILYQKDGFVWLAVQFSNDTNSLYKVQARSGTAEWSVPVKTDPNLKTPSNTIISGKGSNPTLVAFTTSLKLAAGNDYRLHVTFFDIDNGVQKKALSYYPDLGPVQEGETGFSKSPLYITARGATPYAFYVGFWSQRTSSDSQAYVPISDAFSCLVKVHIPQDGDWSGTTFDEFAMIQRVYDTDDPIEGYAFRGGSQKPVSDDYVFLRNREGGNTSNGPYYICSNGDQTLSDSVIFQRDAEAPIAWQNNKGAWI